MQSPGQVSEACFANGTLGNVIPSHLPRAVSAKALTEGNALVLRTLKSAGDHEGVALYSVFSRCASLAAARHSPSKLGSALALHKLCAYSALAKTIVNTQGAASLCSALPWALHSTSFVG